MINKDIHVFVCYGSLNKNLEHAVCFEIITCEFFLTKQFLISRMLTNVMRNEEVVSYVLKNSFCLNPKGKF